MRYPYDWASNDAGWRRAVEINVAAGKIELDVSPGTINDEQCRTLMISSVAISLKRIADAITSADGKNTVAESISAIAEKVWDSKL